MNKKKSILCSAVILTVAILCSLFKIDLSGYLDQISANLNSTEAIKTVSSSDSDRKSVELIKCVDGDTATFNIDGKRQKVRFLGIDTPESVHPYKEVEEFGKDASEYTCNLLTNANTIEISYEDNMSKKDKYGRLLAWVFADNELVQEKLVSIGYAEVKYIYANYTYLSNLYKAEEEAKNKKIGIWYDYDEPIYKDKTYTVTFKVANKEEKVTVKEGERINIIDNPIKNGYVFSGWTYSNQQYDLSKPITKNIIVKAEFSKK